MMINFLAVIACAVSAMVLGFVWYGVLFGKTWARIIGVTMPDKEKRKEMEKKAMPLYAIQFVLVLGQVFVLAHLNGPTLKISLMSALFVWIGFVVPTVAGACMWNNDSRRTAWTRFGLQAGYQLVTFITFGFILGLWR